MNFDTWLTFVAASAALLIIPGPTVLLVVSYALGQGWRAALPTAIGVALGDFTAMSLSLLGIGALLMTSATIFTIVKWAGAAYLIFLGVKLFRAGDTLQAEPRSGAAPGVRMVLHAWLVTSLNPKGVLFFVAFFPQFIDTTRPLLSQIAVLEITFLVLASLNALAFAAFATRARGFVTSPRAVKAVNRVGGGILVGAGIATGAIRSAT